jgi:hypothetical protein
VLEILVRIQKVLEFENVYGFLQSFQSHAELVPYLGREIAQAVSRRLPTVAARVQTRVWSCGIL